MNKQQISNEWNKFRYDYYVSGRVLNFNGLLESSLLMLSYSIEVSMKYLITEYRTNEIRQKYSKIRNTHDINKLFYFMIDNKICNDDICSEDFLSYITNNFLRYPRQVKESYNNFWTNTGSRMLDSTLITYFDDLFLQLNKLIYEKVRTNNSNILIKAIFDHDTYNGRAFFHQNFPAKLAFNDLISSNNSINRQFSNIWNNTNFMVFSDLGNQEVCFSSIEEYCNKRSAKKFCLPTNNTWRY